MKSVIAFTVLSLSLSAFAAEKHEHREHGAHVHGSANLSIAFEGAQGKVEFKSPSESLFGFEHAAKSAADKKAVDDAFKKFESNIAEMIAFDKSLNCQFTKDKIDIVFESKNHSDTAASFSVKCAKSPAGTTLTFNFQKFFPNLKDVDAQIIADTVQKSAEAKANGTSVELK